MKSLKEFFKSIKSITTPFFQKNKGLLASVRKQYSRTLKGASRFFEIRRVIAFFVLASQVMLPFYQLTYASEVGHKANTSQVNVTDSKSKISLDKAIESGQAGTLAKASGGTLKNTAPAIKTATNTPPSVVSSSNDAVKGNKVTLSTKYDVDEGSGAWLYSIPLSYPEGRNGLSPLVSLNYDSRRNNQTSYIGLGWDIEIPTISRMNKNGGDVMFDETNFTSSMSGELVKTDMTLGAKQNGQYAVKYNFGDYVYNDNNTWTYTDKNGIFYVFGNNVRDRLDNGDPDKTSTWSLSYMEDQLGNRVEYTYIKSEGKLYPQSIVYNNNINRIDFTYELYNFKTSVPDYDANGIRLPQDIGSVADFGSGVRARADRKLTSITMNSMGEKPLVYTFTSGDYLKGVSMNGSEGYTFEYKEKLTAPIISDIPQFSLPMHSGKGQYNTVQRMLMSDTKAKTIESVSIAGIFADNFYNQPYNLGETGTMNNVCNPYQTTNAGSSYSASNCYTPIKQTAEVYTWNGSSFAINSSKTITGTKQIDPIVLTKYGISTITALRTIAPAQNPFGNGINGFYVQAGSDQVNQYWQPAYYGSSAGSTYYVPAQGVTGGTFYITWDNTKKLYVELTGTTVINQPTVQTTTIVDPTKIQAVTIDAITQKEIDSYISKGAKSLQFDIDYDNKDDLIVIMNNDIRVYINNGTTVKYTPGFSLIGGNFVDGNYTYAFLRDINGDSKDDFYNGARWFLNRNNQFVYSEDYTLAEENKIVPNLKSATLIDINGDGLLDIPFSQRINTGSGFIVVTQKTINSFGTQTQTYQDNVTFSQMANAGTAQSLITAIPWNYVTYVGQIDFDFDGKQDTIYQSNFSPSQKYILLSKYTGTITDLPGYTETDYVGKMTKINNTTLSGAQSVTITYKKASLDNEYSSNAKATVWVVDKIDTGNTIANLQGISAKPIVYSYQYEQGRIYKDPTELSKRTPLFAKVTETNPLNFTTTSYFHQGNGNDITSFERLDHVSKLGDVYRTEMKNASGKLLSVSTNLYNTTKVSDTKYFKYLEETVSTDSVRNIARASGYTYDLTTGELVRTTDYGKVNTPNDGTYTDITGEDDLIKETTYIALLPLVKPTQVTLKDNTRRTLSETNYVWDMTKGLITSTNTMRDVGVYDSVVYAYSPKGTVTSMADSLGNKTTYTLDAYELLPVSVNNALNQTTSYVYDYFHKKPTKITDANGIVYEYAYNPIYEYETSFKKNGEQLRSAGHNGRNIYEYQYQTVKQPSTTPLKQYNTTITKNTYIDQQGNVYSIGGNDVGTYQFAYDELNREIATCLPNTNCGSSLVKKTYNTDGMLASIQNGLGTTNYSYSGLSTTEINNKGNAKTMMTDIRGNVVSVREVTGGETQYFYSKAGDLTKILDADSNVREFAYNYLGQNTQFTDLHKLVEDTYVTTTLKYDVLGRLTEEQSPDGTSTKYAYDNLNRKTVITLPGDAITYSYDVCSKGNLCSVTRTDGAYKHDFTYNTNGLIATETKANNGISKTVGYEYTVDGKVWKQKYPKQSFEYYYTQNSNPTHVYMNGRPSYALAVTQYQGSVPQYIYAQDSASKGNNYYQYFEYAQDQLGQLKRLNFQKNSVNVSDVNYTFDANGNISTTTDNGTETKKNTSYFYDAIDRLVGVTVTNPLKGLPVDLKYQYSNAGNLITETGVDTIQYNSDGKGNVLPSGIQNVACVAPLIRDTVTNTCKSPTVLAPVKSFAKDTINDRNIITDALAFIFGVQTAYAQVVPVTCTAPQVLDTATNTCKAPVVAPVVCTAPANLDTTTNTCKTLITTQSVAPTTTNLTDTINSLLLKLQSEAYSIKFENGIYTVGDTATTVSTSGNQSGTVQINKGRTYANVTFKTPFLTLPQILVTPSGKANIDFEVTNISLAGFTLSVSNKDYLSKRLFTYLALPQQNVTESEVDDNDPSINNSYIAQNDLLIKEGIITGKTNEFTNPQAILKYNNSYFIYDRKGRLTNVKTFNSDGTIKSDEARTYTGDDRLKTLENATVKETYFYDENGNKIYQSSVTKATNAKEDVFYFNDNYRIYSDREEIDIIIAGKRFATVQVFNNNTENVIYYSNDPLGSSTLAYDEKGILVEQTDTLPYGDKRFAIDSKNVTSKFALHDRNENTNQAYMKARNYDFSNKHFQTQDPISKYAPQQYILNPQELNMYSYARNNPVMYNDPTGNCVGVAAGLDTLACAVVAEATLSWLAAAGTAALATGGIYVYSKSNNSSETLSGDMVKDVVRSVGGTSASAPSPDEKDKKEDKTKIGKYAKDGVRAETSEPKFSKGVRNQVNDEGRQYGCHNCGVKDPKTKSGNFVPDHQPASALNVNKSPQQLYPQCINCSRVQGGQISQIIRRIKEVTSNVLKSNLRK